MRKHEHAGEPSRERVMTTDATLEAQYRETARDQHAEAETLAWIEADLGDALEPESDEAGANKTTRQ